MADDLRDHLRRYAAIELRGDMGAAEDFHAPAWERSDAHPGRMSIECGHHSSDVRHLRSRPRVSQENLTRCSASRTTVANIGGEGLGHFRAKRHLDAYTSLGADDGNHAPMPV